MLLTFLGSSKMDVVMTVTVSLSLKQRSKGARDFDHVTKYTMYLVYFLKEMEGSLFSP